MGEVYYIFGDKGVPRAQVAFSSLVRAMDRYTKKVEKKKRKKQFRETLLAVLERWRPTSRSLFVALYR